MNNKYRNTYEYWHKGVVSNIMFTIETTAKECRNCDGHDLDIVSFTSEDPKYGEVTITFICGDCSEEESINFPIISRKKSQQWPSEPNKLEDMLRKNLQVEEL